MYISFTQSLYQLRRWLFRYGVVVEEPLWMGEPVEDLYNDP